MSNRTTNIIAAILLVIMFVVALTSSIGDSPTMDELAHIPAGYSYLTEQDYRINPEHPPLIKDISSFPLLFLDLNFPTDHSSWMEDINGQWELGRQFLYSYGNNADQILFWSRLPMILSLIFLGWFIFYWAKQLTDRKTALLVLTLFAFSPTFIAHGRLVTTDIGATIGVVLATYFWLRFLKNPVKKNVIAAGLAFGAAMLLKFSLALLIPFFLIVTVTACLLKYQGEGVKKNLLGLLKYAGMSLVAGIIAAMLIWPVYQFHLINYAPERQVNDISVTLESSGMKPLVNLTVWMADKPGLRPYSQYMLGLLMATQRTVGGNTTYFLGMVTASAFWFYFPVIYFLKVPLSFHFLTLMSLLSIGWLIKKPFWHNTLKRMKDWLWNHFVEFSMIVFLIIYWTVSIRGNLNIGVRHILPTFPFIYILVSIGVIRGIKCIKTVLLRKTATATVFLLIGWYVFSSVSIWPFYITYFNEIAHGSENGHKYAVDSNLDWGQDLKRLNNWIEDYNRCALIKCDPASGFGCPSYCYTIANPPPKHGETIDKIYIEYFGGSDTSYYLKERYNSWWRSRPSEEFPKGNFLAISATRLQEGRAVATEGYDQPTDEYCWLNNHKLVTVIGNSIFVYYIE